MILRYRPTLDLDALKASVDLAALVAESGVELRRESTSAGGSLKGPCPFCGGGEDRLVVRPAGRDGKAPGWWCRQCSPRAGSALDWVMAREHLELADAAEWLARWSGLDLSPLSPADLVAHRAEVVARRHASEEREARHREAARVHLAAAWDERRFRRQLAAHAEVVDMLVASGISEYAQERFGFGYGEWAGRPALVIPWYRRKGELESVQYRLLDDASGTDRYRWSTGTSGALWNGEAAMVPGADWLLVCEGAKKGAAAWSAGARSVVAVPNNTSAARILAGQAAALAAFDRVYLCLDPDSTGHARRAVEGLPNARIVSLPAKLDDLIVAHGLAGDELLARLAGARAT